MKWIIFDHKTEKIDVIEATSLNEARFKFWDKYLLNLEQFTNDFKIIQSHLYYKYYNDREMVKELGFDPKYPGDSLEKALWFDAFQNELIETNEDILAAFIKYHDYLLEVGKDEIANRVAVIVRRLQEDFHEEAK